MINITSLPKGWFTAKEAKVPAATLRALANKNIVAINTLFSPQRYCVISNQNDILNLLDEYDFDLAVVVHNSDIISCVKREKGTYVSLADKIDSNGKLIKEPVNVMPFAYYINLYKNGICIKTIGDVE